MDHIPPDEVAWFGSVLGSQAYRDEERGYKVAVHEVIRALFARLNAGGSFVEDFSRLVDGTLHVDAIGMDVAALARVTDATPTTIDLRNAFINLCGGQFGINNFVWIPRALDVGLKGDLDDAFRLLVDESNPLEARVDAFRARMPQIEEDSRARGGWEPNWQIVGMSLAYVGALLGALDPARYTFFHSTRLQRAAKDLGFPWPKQSENAGVRYAAACELVTTVAQDLRDAGLPIADLIDAQSFVYLRLDHLSEPEPPTVHLPAFEDVDAVGTPDADRHMDLLAKWSTRFGRETVRQHIEVAARSGAVWWGVVGSADGPSPLAAARVAQLREQLRRGVATTAYLSGPTCWKAQLLAITADEADVEHELVPNYYAESDTRHALWLKLAEFQETTREWLLKNLDFGLHPGRRLTLTNQRSVLLVRLRDEAEPAPVVGPHEPFDLVALSAACRTARLILDDALLASALAALESGKHVVFTGPPGTAKTTLAEVVARCAHAAGRCTGHVPTTATSDWTTYETIGGLRPAAGGLLEFAEGHFLRAIRTGKWLVIDELNRSNFDRAFGQLFTVLSGQAVVLPYERGAGPIAIVPHGAAEPPGTDVVGVPESWRVIATMNVFDKSLLFEMSFALMRRFAFIEVPAPPWPTFARLIEEAAEGDAEAIELVTRLYHATSIRGLGPALFMDIGRYLRQRALLGPTNPGVLAFDAFYAFLLPQFEGIDDAGGQKLFDALKPIVQGPQHERLRTTMNSVLGLSLPAPKSATDTAADEVADAG